LSYQTWGENKKPLLSIYKSLILFKIKYGSQTYNTVKPNLLKILNTIHNEGIRLAIGAFGTSPIDSVLNYAGELPLKLHRDQNTLTHIINRKNTTNYIGYKTIFNNHTSSPINMKHKKTLGTRPFHNITIINKRTYLSYKQNYVSSTSSLEMGIKT
jgi:hypothetical protein